jgi:hypothetical protein
MLRNADGLLASNREHAVEHIDGDRDRHLQCIAEKGRIG